MLQAHRSFNLSSSASESQAPLQRDIALLSAGFLPTEPVPEFAAQQFVLRARHASHTATAESKRKEEKKKKKALARRGAVPQMVCIATTREDGAGQD